MFVVRDGIFKGGRTTILVCMFTVQVIALLHTRVRSSVDMICTVKSSNGRYMYLSRTIKYFPSSILHVLEDNFSPQS